MLLAATVAISYALLQVARSARAARWPSVEGELARARVLHRASASDGSDDYAYVPYRYTVHGHPYRGDRWHFGPQVLPTSSRAELDAEPAEGGDELLLRMPFGAPLRIRYNPRDPAESVVSPTPSAGALLIGAAGIVFAYAALFGGP